MTRTLVLVGHGMVGHHLLESLVERAADGDWRVVVFAEEPRRAYDRVRLSSYFQGATPDDLLLGDDDLFAEHPIELRLGDRVAAIDPAARSVTSISGHRVTYDALVLATGSYPFVPPVSGREAVGCFVYRTVEDLQAIEAYAGGRRAGAVVGGGLLGLEAANALRSLGLATHVVEFAPRLMPMQVDDGGGTTLRRHIEQLGVTVHTGARTEAVATDPDGRVTGMRLAERDELLAVDLVVFAAGVRPRDDLARDAGLPVGERGGIVVDDGCRTADPHIYAIGECAVVDGRVYALVGPGYAMADVVAARLCGDDNARFTGADTSTKLKLLGVDVASFGDPQGGDDALGVLYADSLAGVYRRVNVDADGRLLGGVLVGDATGYEVLRLRVGSQPDGPADGLVLPGGAGRAAAGGDLPDEATVCSCLNVSAGRIRAATRDEGCTGPGDIKRCTKAGSGCGSCIPLIGTLVAKQLESQGIAPSTALCEHFDASRQELFEIVQVKGITSFSRLLRQHGRGAGCEVCKPAVASILASLGSGHILDGEQAGLQDTNDFALANLQRNGSYSVVPRIPGGEITPDGLITIGEIAREFGLYTKITGGQRIDMFGARLEQLPLIWRRLVDAGFESGHAYGKALRTVKSCVGTTWCRYGVQDSVALAIALELRYRGLRAPHKIKAAVSGCARECAEARGKDFGVIATENGWNLYVGGNGGFTPRHADLLAQDMTTEALVRAIDRFLMFYIRTADRLERTARWLERMHGGLDHVRDVIIEDGLGIGTDLDAMMARHVAGYTDEWRAVLEDPERLRKFTSFVNAPDVPDPSIRFVPQRDQKRAARPDEVPQPVMVAGARLPVLSRR
jgi:nitrite reductase (NADH) large subunit